MYSFNATFFQSRRSAIRLLVVSVSMSISSYVLVGSTTVLSGQEISAKVIGEVWDKTRIDNVSLTFENEADFKSTALSTFSLAGKEKTNKRVTVHRNMLFRYLYKEGMYLEVTGGTAAKRRLNQANGKSLSVIDAEDGRPYSVTENFDVETSEINHDIVVGRFLIWLNPANSRIANDIKQGNIASFLLQPNQEFGNLAVGKIGDEKVVLAEKYFWRPIVITAVSPQGKPVSHTEFSYSLNQNRLVMIGWKSTKFNIQDNKASTVSQVKVSDCEFDLVEKKDLAIAIPKDSLIVRIRSGIETNHYLDKDGYERIVNRNELAVPIDPSTASKEELEAAKDAAYKTIRTPKSNFWITSMVWILGVGMLLMSTGIWVARSYAGQ